MFRRGKSNPNSPGRVIVEEKECYPFSLGDLITPALAYMCGDGSPTLCRLGIAGFFARVILRECREKLRNA
jgi:hypothetical protein